MGKSNGRNDLWKSMRTKLGKIPKIVLIKNQFLQLLGVVGLNLDVIIIYNKEFIYDGGIVKPIIQK